MDDRLKESISALMDDESNEVELQRILSRTDDNDVQETWHTYHSIRNALGGSKQGSFQIDVSAHVSKAIAEESNSLTMNNKLDDIGINSSSDDNWDNSSLAVNESNKGSTNTYFTAKAIFALAASVAFVFFFMIDNSQEIIQNHGNPIAESQNESAPAAQLVSVNHQPKILEKLSANQVKHFNRYLLRHAELMIRNTNTGFIPLARVASVNAVGV